MRRRPRAFEEVVSSIKKAVFDGVWKRGEKLPSENELASQFLVSRHTIREALRTLEYAGIVTIRTGVSGGPIVRNAITNTIGKLYIDAFQMEDVTAGELTAARLVIEKAIMEEAIKRRDEKDIESLKVSIAKAKGLVAQRDLAGALNFEFHSLLAQASKNRAYVILGRATNAMWMELRKRVTDDVRTAKYIIESHEEILQALIKRNRQEALDLIEKHVRRVGKTFERDLRTPSLNSPSSS